MRQAGQFFEISCLLLKVLARGKEGEEGGGETIISKRTTCIALSMCLAWF